MSVLGFNNAYTNVGPYLDRALSTRYLQHVYTLVHDVMQLLAIMFKPKSLCQGERDSISAVVTTRQSEARHG
jgi:hypothetical protein